MVERRAHTLSDSLKHDVGPFKDMGTKSFRVFLRYLNQEYLQQLKEDFEGAPIGPNQCLIVVGSDGKKERHKQSKTDLVLLERQGEGSVDIADFLQWYEGTHPQQAFSQIFDLHPDHIPQVTKLGDLSTPASYAYPHLFRNPARIYPDRVLNSQLICGNEEVYFEGREQVLHEMSNDGKMSRKIRVEMANQLKQYRRAIETQSFRGIQIFSDEPPIQFYDEDPDRYATGFKTAFLRSTQRYLDIVTTMAIRKGFLTVEDAARDLPTTTVERIKYLRGIGALPSSDLTKQVQTAYLWFLQQYHYAQELYKSSRELVHPPFDLALFEKFRDIILEFTKDGHYDDLQHHAPKK